MKNTTDQKLVRIYTGVILAIWICMPYTLLQRFAFYEVQWATPSALDAQIPVNFDSLWVYLSLPVLLAIVGLRVGLRTFMRYMYAMGWTAMAAHMVFMLYPSGLQRSEIDLSLAPQVYHWLIAVDAPRNVMPSLHVALATLAVIAAWSSSRFHITAKIGFVLWCGAIAWSTVALRQHILLDGLAGAIVAAACWQLVQKFCKKEFDQIH